MQLFEPNNPDGPQIIRDGVTLWPNYFDISAQQELVENIRAFVGAVAKAKPSGSKGTYMKKVSLSSTMGPGVSIDVFNAAGE